MSHRTVSLCLSLCLALCLCKLRLHLITSWVQLLRKSGGFLNLQWLKDYPSNSCSLDDMVVYSVLSARWTFIQKIDILNSLKQRDWQSTRRYHKLYNKKKEKKWFFCPIFLLLTWVPDIWPATTYELDMDMNVGPSSIASWIRTWSSLMVCSLWIKPAVSVCSRWVWPW